jgi:nicotinate-nucleotide adenylyltransferase
LIAFLGGTFDPVHLGHLHAAREVRSRLGCDEVRFVLAAVPSHRPAPEASAADRWEMLIRALVDVPGCVADDTEIGRTGPSYTVDTLATMRQRFGAARSLAWVVGFDAYRLLPTWRRWQELLSLTHLVVVGRPGQDDRLDPVMAGFTARFGTDDPAELRRSAAGRVLEIKAEMLAISASEVRARCHRGEPVADLLPPAVWAYIESASLYRTEAPPRNGTSTPA